MLLTIELYNYTVQYTLTFSLFVRFSVWAATDTRLDRDGAHCGSSVKFKHTVQSATINDPFVIETFLPLYHGA